MKLTILGSGSPEATARRASSGYLIEVSGQRILFDCGGGVVGRLLEAGLMPSDIDILFFSHLHSDHMMDYARLVHAAWDAGAGPLRVFGPAPIAHMTEQLFGRGGVFDADLRARTELPPSLAVWKARGKETPRPWPAPIITEIAPGFSHEGEGWRLTSVEVPHAQPVLSSMAFRIEAEGRSFVYSGDAGLTPEWEAFCHGADLLLHWCYRRDGESLLPELDDLMPTPTDIGTMATRAGVKHLLLTHMRVQNDANDIQAEIKAALAASFAGPSGVAEDLQVFEV